MEYIKSPIVYQGNKHKLLKHIHPLFPKTDLFVDLFGGSGVVSFNSDSKYIIYNELNYKIKQMIEYLYVTKGKNIEAIKGYIENLNIKSVKKDDPSYKEYYKNYNEFRDSVNKMETTHIFYYYILHLFSINNLIRFNKKGEFNASYGAHTGRNPNIAFEILESLPYHKKISFKNMDFEELVNKIFDSKLNSKDTSVFFYCDPPYTNTTAVYNENRLTGWKIDDDYRLLKTLDKINSNGKYFGFSNTFVGKNGVENTHLKEWAEKNNYYIHYIDKKYSSFGKSNQKNQEVYITNYKRKDITWKILN